MPNGRIYGRSRWTRRVEAGVGCFANEEGSTTVACAVAILVSLVLVFGMANVQWVTSRAADVQVVADAGALAGANVVATYATVVQVLDAVVLSLGLVGVLALCIGLVISALPLVNAAGPPVLNAASSMLEVRASLARTAAQGLQKLERALPYLVAANSFAAVRANADEEGSYVGLALPMPLEGASDFGLLDANDVAGQVEQVAGHAQQIEAATQEAYAAQQRADAALERGWSADCGSVPSMRERAQTLAGLTGAFNPGYPTVSGWDFGVAIRRAQAYYAQRVAIEAPASSSPEEMARSAARGAFYRYALEQVELSVYRENDDGTVTCALVELPANTADVRQTTLYTDAVWPCTEEAAGRTIHAYAACPGATGAPSGYASVAQEEAGACLECPVCQFDVVDLGRTPAASTSIENGFEHHWRLVVQASRDYAAARLEQARLEGDARAASEEAVDAFERALAELAAVRVELSPPGRYGCVCIVVDPTEHHAPDELVALVESGATLPPRVAVAAAALARDQTAQGTTLLADFFDGLVAQGGLVGGASSVLDAVATAWGDLLVLYGNGYAALTGGMQQAFDQLAGWGSGGVAVWLREALMGAVELAALEPADLSAKKPVLVNTVDVTSRVGNSWYAALRTFVVAVQSVDLGAGPASFLAALGVAVESLGGSSLVVAHVPIPGTDRTIPLEVDLEWLADLGLAA